MVPNDKSIWGDIHWWHYTMSAIGICYPISFIIYLRLGTGFFPLAEEVFPVPYCECRGSEERNFKANSSQSLTYLTDLVILRVDQSCKMIIPHRAYFHAKLGAELAIITA